MKLWKRLWKLRLWRQRLGSVALKVFWGVFLGVALSHRPSRLGLLTVIDVARRLRLEDPLVHQFADLPADRKGQLLAVPGDLYGLVLVPWVQDARHLGEVQVVQAQPAHLESSAETFEDIGGRLPHWCEHLGIALEAAGAVHGEDEDHMRGTPEGLVELLLVPARCGPHLVLDRQDQILVVAALHHKVPCPRVAVDLRRRGVRRGHLARSLPRGLPRGRLHHFHNRRHLRLISIVPLHILGHETQVH
mmetsp:Transcript_25141/g.56633  ORF Transcript_25141/g.56633 Transcript_25141/m.56633 type:complete len:247 (-) Transcript_25141:54-794(-)